MQLKQLKVFFLLIYIWAFNFFLIKVLYIKSKGINIKTPVNFTTSLTNVIPLQNTQTPRKFLKRFTYSFEKQVIKRGEEIESSVCWFIPQITTGQTQESGPRSFIRVFCMGTEAQGPRRCSAAFPGELGGAGSHVEHLRHKPMAMWNPGSLTYCIKMLVSKLPVNNANIASLFPLNLN